MQKRSHAIGVPPRAWQRMLSGRRLDLLDPSPLDVEIDDIAHGLARVARWNGQTRGAYAFSVAEHSVIVERIVRTLYPRLDRRWYLAALLHDSSEYVIGDMISPFKAALGYNYREFEDRLEAAVHIRFGLPPKTPADIKRRIKRADRICAHLEAVQIAGFGEKEARQFFGPVPSQIDLEIRPVPANKAQALFMDRFHALMADIEPARKRRSA